MAVIPISSQSPVKAVQPSSQQRHSAAYLTHFLNTQSKSFSVADRYWQDAQPGDRSAAVLTIVAPALTLDMVEQVITALSTCLTCGAIRCHALHQQFGDGVVTIEVQVDDAEAARAQLHTVADTVCAELALQAQRPVLGEPGLLVMDMDSTLIQIECIDEIARLGNVGDEVASVTRMAMRGELDFRDSLLTRVACLKGIDATQLEQIRQAMPLMPGAALLVQVLQQHHWKVAVASGGFTFFADHLAQRLGLDYAVSNVLEIDADRLTGKVQGDIVDAKKKAETVKTLAEQWHIAPGQTVAMGDGANDLLMMEAAALGVACHAKPAVVAKADVAIARAGLHTLLYLLA